MTHGQGDGVDDAAPTAPDAPASGGDGTDADADADGNADADGRALDPAALADLAAEDWRAALAAAGELEPAIAREIIDTHGDRGRRAIEAVSEGRVKAYRDFTVVVGHRAEHVVEGGGCDCQDAAYNLDPADPQQRCWHALAVDVAERVGRVDDHDMWYSEVREFL